MLNPYYGLFQYSRDDIYTLQINPDSAVNPVSGPGSSSWASRLLWQMLVFSFSLFAFLGAFVLFPLCGKDYGNGCFPRALHRRRLHSALLQAVARETHHSGRHGVSGSRSPQQPRLDPVSVLYTSINSTVLYTLKNCNTIITLHVFSAKEALEWCMILCQIYI